MKTASPLAAAVAAVAAATLLAACATPEVTKVRKAGDDELTCEQIKREYQDAQDFEEKARKERGVTGTNVAAAVLFWPALLGTYANTEEAITAARDRKTHLERVAEAKRCRI